MGRMINVGDTVEVLNGRLAGAVGKLVSTRFQGPSIIEILYPPVLVEPGDQVEIMPCQLRAVELVDEPKPAKRKK